MDRGDVVRVDLPAPSGKPGREQIGERPSVILQINKATTNLSTLIVVPFTSNQQSARMFGSVLVQATKDNGLSVDSVALVHQMRVIDKRRVRRIEGRLSPDDLARVDANVREILGL
jgi:mRNA interferase MazF